MAKEDKDKPLYGADQKYETVTAKGPGSVTKRVTREEPAAASTAKKLEANKRVEADLDLGPRYAAARAAGAPLSPFEERMAKKGGLLGTATAAPAGEMTQKELLETTGSLLESAGKAGIEDPAGYAMRTIEQVRAARAQDPTPAPPPDDIYRGTKTIDGKEVPFFFNTGAAMQKDAGAAEYAKRTGVSGVSLLGGDPVVAPKAPSIGQQRKEGYVPPAQSQKPPIVPYESRASEPPGSPTPTQQPQQSVLDAEDPTAFSPQQTDQQLTPSQINRINRRNEKRGQPTAWESLFRRIMGTGTQDLTEFGIM